MSDQNTPSATARTPPYISFKTLLTLLEELRTNGFPDRIDRSVLRRFSGGVGTQLLIAVRSLGLVDDDDKPTEVLRRMVEADDDGLRPLLQAILHRVYPNVFKLDLMSATPSMFAEAFKLNLTAKEDVLRKCRTFFLHAAKKADIPLGARLMSGHGPRASNGSPPRRKPRTPKGTPEKTASVSHAEDTSSLGEDRAPAASVLEQLLQKFPEFDPSWDAGLKEKWFEGFSTFMAQATKKG